MSARLFFAVILHAQTFVADSSGLRGLSTVNTEVVEESLFDELASSFRSGSAGNQDRVARLEAAFQHLFAAAPKQSDGTVSPPVVRNMLHRYFVKEHGWNIAGLEPGTHHTSADVVASQSAMSIKQVRNMSLKVFQDWVADYLQRFMAQLHQGKDLTLHEVAIIAGTLESLVHKEAVSYLDLAYKALEIPTSTALDLDSTKELVDVWIMAFLLRGRFKPSGKDRARRAHKRWLVKMNAWGGMRDWVAQQLVSWPGKTDSGTYNFDDLAHIVEKFSQNYASFNERECQALRSKLLSIESKKAGRIRLSQFYKTGLSGVFRLTEKEEVLREAGALDESDPLQPHVIIPNYAGSRSNCILPSSFYAVCCRNECEELVSALEKKVSTEGVTPEQILDAMSSLESATISATRVLSESLKQRLYSIAKNHEGQVPVHGRLFAQWMHHAFPRECPAPQGIGTTKESVAVEKSGKVTATEEEMRERISSDTCGADEPVGLEARKYHDSKENELPWDDSEDVIHSARSVPHTSGGIARRLAPISLVSSLVFLACKYLLEKGRSEKFDFLI